MDWETRRMVKRIEEKNPLKQGLKLFDGYDYEIGEGHWREESIKTRIETSPISLHYHVVM